MDTRKESLPLFAADEPNADYPAGEAEAPGAGELSFEEAYEALEETVRQLERGDSTIDDLVGLYERGMALAGLCSARLDAAELRITKLRPTAEGEYEEEPFEE